VALIVEDGTGLADAEAYVSVAFADAYHLSMGSTAWAALGTTAKEQALRRGTQYLDSNYRFNGLKKTTTQRLEWPRETGSIYGAGYGSLYPQNYYPWPVRCVQEACCELALRSSAATLLPDESQAVKMEKIGPITVEYADGSGVAPRYPMIDYLLRNVTSGGGPGQIRIERI
jgi:hypothetical protein